MRIFTKLKTVVNCNYGNKRILCCKKEMKYFDRIKAYGMLIYGGEYCKECWTNKKNWERIHKLKPSEE